MSRKRKDKEGDSTGKAEDEEISGREFEKRKKLLQNKKFKKNIVMNGLRVFVPPVHWKRI